MFESLPQHFRNHQLQADVRTLMLLRKSMDRGLVRTLGDMYLVLKGLVTNDPTDYGPFTEAFYSYFLEIEIRPGETLQQAIQRSRIFQEWLQKEDLGEDPDIDDLIDQFLSEIHLSSYDIKEIIDGEEIFRNDNPELEDELPEEGEEGEMAPPDTLDLAADYSNMPLEELLERMKEIARQQRMRHGGGSHWIGQGGISPYGHGGAAVGGIRTGGVGGGKMARKVIGDRQFYPVDIKMPLSDDNIDVALSFLKGIEDESADYELDIPVTIKEGVKEGGLFLPHEREKIEQKIQILLFIDNGGRSMSPYIRMVLKLFAKMKRRFAHDLKTYYYHNTIYGGAFTDPARRQFEPIDKILAHHPGYSVFVVGDADMAPYELSWASLGQWQAILARFPRSCWLNPLRERYWPHSMTVNLIKEVFPMFPLTPAGLEQAVLHMNSKRKYSRRR